jgi:multidrug efflux pump subunit AcrB
MLTIKTANSAKMKSVLEQLQNYYKSKKIKTVNTFKIADGGNLNEFIILLGFSNWEEYAVSEDIMDEISKIESKTGDKTIDSIQSETLIYRDDLSYFP